MLLPVSLVGVELTTRDFVLFRQEFAREVEKMLPVSVSPLFWPTAEQRPSADEAQLRRICAVGKPARLADLLVLPLPLADGECEAVLLQGMDPGLSRKMAQEWLEEVRDQLRANLELIKQAHVHPETGLYSSRLLHSQLAAASSEPRALLLVGAAHRSAPPSAGLFQLVQTARLLRASVAGAVFYLGGNLYGVLQDDIGREAALASARRLLSRLRREGLHTVHIGIAVRGGAGGDDGTGSWFDECWQALQIAERRGPYGLCEASVLRRQQAHPLARPGTEIMRSLARGWRGADRFGLLLFSREERRTDGVLGDQIRNHLAAGEVLVPVSRSEAYLLLPDITEQKALHRGRVLLKKLAQGSGEAPVSLAISSWPCLTYSRGEATVNCRRALLHGRFLGPGAVTVFDHLSLNVSGDYFFDEGDYRHAVRDYRDGLLLNPGDVNLMNSLGVALAELNRQQQAITVFDRVLAASPHNFMALANKGFAQRMLGHHDAALATFEQAARHRGFRKSTAFADISLQLGRLYCAAGRYREALAILERLEASGKDHSGFHLERLLGEAYAGVGRNTQAIPALQRAVRHNGHDAQSLSILGELYARQEQGDDIALSLCRRAVALDDTQAKHWYRLAWVHAKMGADEAARKAVGEALRRNRRDPQVLLLAGQIYRRLGLGGKARAIHRRLEQTAGHRSACNGMGLQRAEHQHE